MSRGWPVLGAAGLFWLATWAMLAPPRAGFAATSVPPSLPAVTARPNGPPAELTNAVLWRMSRDPAVVSSGQRGFRSSSCGSCHGFMLTGGTGPNLIDRGWLHGGTPLEVFKTITQGVPSKGMPTWGPVLDPRMIGEIVAYIFSHHQEGETIVVQTSFTPGSPGYRY